VTKKILFLLLFLFIFSLYSAADESPYGINAHAGSNNVLLKVKEAGIRWIRIDLYWSDLEREKGNFDFSEIDRIVDYSLGNGLSILGVLSSTPGWSNNNQGINYPPDNIDDWKNFVSITARRYKDKIRYWNIWNEPNVEKFFAPGKAVFVKDIFLPAAESIRKESPLSLIAGPELAHLEGQGSEWYFWLKYILTECSQYIDIVSHHIYKNTGVYAIFESLEIGENITPSVKDVIKDSGFSSAPFWITETGWDTELFSEEEQGNRYLEFLQEMEKRNYPDKIFFYQIIDDATPGIRPWGIIKSNFTEKPAYSIYADFIAGIYPRTEDSEPEQLSKKCYMEESVAMSNIRNKNVFIKNLRQIRRVLNRFPISEQFVTLYYNSVPILKQIAVNFPEFRKYSLNTAIVINYLFKANHYTIIDLVADLKP